MPLPSDAAVATFKSAIVVAAHESTVVSRGEPLICSVVDNDAAISPAAGAPETAYSNNQETVTVDGRP